MIYIYIHMFMILLGCYAPQYSTVGGYQDMLRKLCGYDTMPNRQQEIAGRGQKTQRGGRRGTQAEKRGCTQRIGGSIDERGPIGVGLALEGTYRNM
jgi:hypothetical protein